MQARWERIVDGDAWEHWMDMAFTRDLTYPCPGALGTHHAVRSPHRSDGTRHASHADILVAIGQSPREPRQPATKSATEIARSAGQWRVMVAL